MIISTCGTACIGKSTFIEDFLKTWPNFKTPTKTYRDFLKSENLPHSKETTKDTQWRILQSLEKQIKQYSRTKDYIIHDRSPIDNLVYSLWCLEKGVGDIDKEFIDKCIPIVRESLRLIDVIFFLPITRVAPVEIVSNGVREVDPVYRSEIDTLFKALAREWDKPNSPFVKPDDKPAWIEIFGKPHERIQMVKLYLDADGDPIGGDGGSGLELPKDYLEKIWTGEAIESAPPKIVPYS